MKIKPREQLLDRRFGTAPHLADHERVSVNSGSRPEDCGSWSALFCHPNFMIAATNPLADGGDPAVRLRGSASRCAGDGYFAGSNPAGPATGPMTLGVTVATSVSGGAVLGVAVLGSL